MTTKQRKTRSDTVAGQMGARKDLDRVLPPPDGVVFDTDQEMVLWRQYSSARSLESWREMDLLLLTKLVKLEVRILNAEEMIASEGAVIENNRGTVVENAWLRVLDTYQRQQLAIIRSLSLGVSSDGARDANKGGAKASDKKDLAKLAKGQVIGLLNG
jgi:hypothetical protein